MNTLLRYLAAIFLVASIQSFTYSARPNILFIIADDLNCAIGPYGDAVAVTPNLDRLADRGVTFKHAYCQQAVCNPSRSSFLTGLRPDKVKVDDLRKYFRESAADGDSLITMPEYFKNNGYFCQNIGKIFHNMGETQDRRSWSIDEVLYRGTHAADTVFANQSRGTHTPNMKAPVTEAHDVPDTVYRDGNIAEFAASAIENYSTKQPWFLAVGFWRPHLPFVAPKRYWDLYDPKKIPAPSPTNRPDGVPEIAMHDSREIRGYGNKRRDRVLTPDEIRHFRHGYYASISFLDAQVGKILNAVDEGLHRGNTIIVFTSDHGFHIGEQELWGKTTNFELDARVPLIVSDPAQKSAHAKSTESIAELIDIYPTLADLADLKQGLPANLDGTSLAKIVRDPSVSVKNAAFTQHQHPFYGSKKNWQAWGYSVRTDRWRYTEWRDIESDEVVASELYDYQSDPLETQNVIGPHHNKAIQECKVLLHQQFPPQIKHKVPTRKAIESK